MRVLDPAIRTLTHRTLYPGRGELGSPLRVQAAGHRLHDAGNEVGKPVVPDDVHASSSHLSLRRDGIELAEGGVCQGAIDLVVVV